MADRDSQGQLKNECVLVPTRLQSWLFRIGWFLPEEPRGWVALLAGRGIRKIIPW
jgi:hypothetical protein